MTGRLRVAVIGGGRSSEHQVSLASAASVVDGLAAGGAHDVVALTIGRDGTWSCQGAPIGLSRSVGLLAGCDAVFPVLHGLHGEDGTMAALCDLAGVPWVGGDVRAGALGVDKWVTKVIAQQVGVWTAAGRLVTSPDDVIWTGPVVIKPVSAGSSHGVTLVQERHQFGPALAAALALDDRVLVEDVVRGREVGIAVLTAPDGRRVVSPPLEIVVEGDIFDTAGKYGGTAEFRVPAQLPSAVVRRLESDAVAVVEALGADGVCRVDFFVTPHGCVLNEVNTTPGMTEHSQVPQMFAAAGMPYRRLLAELVQAAVARHRRREADHLAEAVLNWCG